MIDVEGLVFDYPTARALFGVSFRIEPGTVTALVGPNGAGKTTLLRCLATLEMPYAGRVRVDGVDVVDHPRQVRQRLGFLDEFFGLYDELTVLQCLRNRAAIQNVPGDERAVAQAAAERLGLSDRLGHKAGSLSRGLRQRLAIAQAIIHQPRVLLMDEPASGLDPDARDNLSALIRDLQAGGMTIIVSSHILAELEDYSSHMLIVDRGRIVDHAPIAGAGRPAGASHRLHLALAAPGSLGAVLEAQPGVAAVELAADGLSASCRFAGDGAARAALLKALVDGGLAVAAFGVADESLQEVYRRQVRNTPR